MYTNIHILSNTFVIPSNTPVRVRPKFNPKLIWSE